MDQLQCSGLVDSVSLGPVDTNLEGFLKNKATRERYRKIKGKESEVKSLAVNSDDFH